MSFKFPKHFLLLLNESAWLAKEDHNQPLKKHTRNKTAFHEAGMLFSIKGHLFCKIFHNLLQMTQYDFHILRSFGISLVLTMIKDLIAKISV